MKRTLLCLLLLSLPRPALASGPIGVGAPIEAAPVASGGLETGNRRAYWSRGNHRWFVSSLLDAGYLYARPQIAVGYGKPHWRYFQVETFGTISGGGGAPYAGIRMGLPFLELRSGARYQIPFTRSFLPREASYDRFDLENRLAPTARYLAFDNDLQATIPAYKGTIFTLLSLNYVTGVPDGYDVYEEQVRVIGTAPWFTRARLGYAFRLGEQGAIRIGPVVEWIYNLGRKTTTIRAGVVATVVLTHHLEVLATLVPTITSPDRIGLTGGDFGQLGIRYRWASPAPPSEPSERTEP